MIKEVRKLISLLLLLIPTNYLFAETADYSSLKAVLIVGHEEDDTHEAIADMNEIADLFTQYKVTVYKFYDEKAIWSEITKVTPECNFLVYSGHGSVMGIDGKAGGICINPETVSTAQLIADLRLKENALVLFKSVCGGAGSSAGDQGDIGIDEARDRVMNYAYPFFEVGAAAYYANNYGSGVYNFLKNFLDGKSLYEGYVSSTSPWSEIEFEETFPKDTSKSFSIASRPGGGTATLITYTNGVKKEEKVISPKQYNVAYVGKKSFSIKNMLE